MDGGEGAGGMRTAVAAVAASSALGRQMTRTRIACEGRPTEREARVSDTRSMGIQGCRKVTR